MKRKALLLAGALPLSLCVAAGARAQVAPAPDAQTQGAATQDKQPETAPPDAMPAPAAPQSEPVKAAMPDLQTPATPPPPPVAATDTATDAGQQDANELEFTADQLDYDYDADIVTATGNVRLTRQSDRLRADKVTWNRKTGQVVAEGNIVAISAQGDTAYGDRADLTDTLKTGVIDNMLVVLDAGGRIAAERGTRDNGIYTVENAAYTPCNVLDSDGCPKNPSWKITAKRVTYDPEKQRIRYVGARVSVFGFATIPLPALSHPVGNDSASGFLAPDIRYNATNGVNFALPYFFSFSPSNDLTVTPRVFSDVLPLLQVDYRELTNLGAFRVSAYGTYSRRSDDPTVVFTPATSMNDFRGYFDAVGNFQLDPNWSANVSLRLTSDRTFLRRYDISSDDRLRNNVSIQRIDENSYLSINSWAVQTLRLGESQGLQPLALPEIDYRRRFDDGLTGGRFEAEVNTLAITRSQGEDTQRAFASLRWDWRKLTPWGQEITVTGYARGDLYNADDVAATLVPSYQGLPGFHTRGIAAAAVDVRWPFIGSFLGGTQQITPRFQVVATPKLANLEVPNEDARAVDLEDSNLFALNRFPGYDRFDDSTRVTWGLDYALYLPGFSIESNIGQSYRLSAHPTLFPDGTGLSDRVSDFVGRTVIRWHDFISLTHRFRLDKDGLAVRRNEIDATVGSRSTYVLVGYLRLNRNITEDLEDLEDREEIRLGGRVQITRFWSASGSTLIDLTDSTEDPRSTADGFDPVRHRLGIQYEDDCLRIGVTWRRDYQTTGDARRGNSYLLTLAFKNLGR